MFYGAMVVWIFLLFLYIVLKLWIFMQKRKIRQETSEAVKADTCKG